METQTHFNLNAAIENWRQVLSDQPSLSPEERRELESHLRDSVAELQQRGLNDEESFWLAHRRLGPPRQLAEEFVIADPSRMWRERLFWMALALLTIKLWSQAFSAAMQAVTNFNQLLPQWVAFYIPLWIQDLFRNARWNIPIISVTFYVAFVALLIMFARGQPSRRSAAIHALLRNRWLFMLAAAILVLAIQLPEAMIMATVYLPVAAHFLRPQAYLQLSTSFGLVAILGWLLPSQENRDRIPSEAN